MGRAGENPRSSRSCQPRVNEESIRSTVDEVVQFLCRKWVSVFVNFCAGGIVWLKALPGLSVRPSRKRAGWGRTVVRLRLTAKRGTPLATSR